MAGMTLIAKTIRMPKEAWVMVEGHRAGAGLRSASEAAHALILKGLRAGKSDDRKDQSE